VLYPRMCYGLALPQSLECTLDVGHAPWDAASDVTSAHWLSWTPTWGNRLLSPTRASRPECAHMGFVEYRLAYDSIASGW